LIADFFRSKPLGRLVQIDQRSPIFFGNRFQGSFERLVAIAASRSEDVAQQAMCVHADQNWLRRIADIPADRELWIHCASGYRASIAAALLDRYDLDVVLIDDRTHTDLAHGAAPPPPLASFDDASQVVAVGGMSKLYWGGLRLGWIRARSSLINRLIEHKAGSDLGTSAPMQIIAAEWLLHHHEATRTWRNEQLRESLEALESALTASMPAAEWERPAGGPNLWIRLPGTNALEFSHRALADGVAVIPGPLLSSRPGRATDRIRVPFYAEPATLVEAVTRLGRCWAQMTGRTPSRVSGVLHREH